MLLPAGALAAALPAQSPSLSVSGRVLRGGRDTVPLADTWVVLHRITRTSAGPQDSVRTDRRGRYRIPLRDLDTTAVYVVSAWYDSLAYFSLPLNVIGRSAVHVEDIVTYATTAGAPPIQLARRLLTVARAGQAGNREVLEILELENSGVTTRITRDSLLPTWAGRLPDNVSDVRVGQGDLSAEAVTFRNDSIHVLGPIPPGPAKQLTYSYTLPRDERILTVPIDQDTREVNLLIEDTTALVTATGLEALGVKEIEQRFFATYRAGPLPEGERVTIELPRGAVQAQMILPYVIALLAIGLVVALVWALKRKPLASPSSGS
ncbi:MAG: hypothetical protein ACREMN_11830 [Gemmatimonadales bacterium]